MRIERLAGRNRRDGVIELAARFFGIPVLECVSGFHRRSAGRGRLAVRLHGFGKAGLAVDRAAVAACVPCDRQRNRCAAIVALSIAVRIGVVCIFIARISASRARLGTLMLRFAVRNPRTVGIAVICIIIGRRATGRTGFCTSVLRITVLAPCASGIAMISVFRCGVPTSTAGCRSAMLIGRRIAPRSVAHAVAGVFVIRIAAVPAIGFAPVLTAGIFLPASIGIAVAGCVDGLALALAAIAAILPVPIPRASGIIFIVQNPCMTAAVRASPRTIRAGTVIFIHISPQILNIMAL